MVKRMRWMVLGAIMVANVGCYHATVNTGLEPSTKTVEKRWASGWVYGLVPPKPIDTKEACDGNPSRVDTQLSFPNQLVSFLTLGIYTPMEIVVTCASR